MDPNRKKTYARDKLIRNLALDPFYGVRLSKDDSAELTAEYPVSTIPWLVRGESSKPSNDDKEKNDCTKESPDWEHFTANALFYETESEYTRSILNSIYEGRPSRQNFKVRFEHLPCKANLLLHLVYAWCGLLGLPYSRNGQSPVNPESDTLDYWSRDFEIRLEDLKVFLRKNSWPLPVSIFENEPDNTQKKVKLSNKAYEKLVRKQLVLIPQLKQQLKEVSAIQAESMSAHEKKQQEMSKLNQQVEILMGPSPTHSRSTTPMTKRERGKLATQERYLDWSRQAAIILKQNPKMVKTDIAKRIFRKQEKRKYAWRYICKNMNLEKK